MTKVAATDPGDAALGERVRQLRLSRGLTLRDTALRLEVSAATLSAIENGRTRLTVARLERLAQVLQAPVASLLTVAAMEGAPAPGPVSRGDESPEPGLYTDGAWRAYPPLDLGPVLTAALTAMLETGYHGASIREIARGAGLSVPGLYHHYPSKQEMLVAILDFTLGDLLARTGAVLEEGRDPVERFSLLIECLTLYHSYRRELAFVGASEMRSLQPGSRHRIIALRSRVQLQIDKEVEDAVTDGAFGTSSPHVAARAVVTMCTAVAAWYRAGGPTPPEELAEQYVDFALDLMRRA